MAKLTDLPLTDLYARPKMTAAVRNAILLKEDFSQISPNYCEKVCTLKCKTPQNVELEHHPVDILIVQDHHALAERYKTEDEMELIHQGVVQYLALKYFEGLTYRFTELTKCVLGSRDITNGKPPTQAHLRKCSPYLMNEIAASQPKVIISLTTVVTKELGFPKLSNSANRGEIHYSDMGIPVVITLHPKVTMMIRQNASGQMWGTDFLEVIDRDFSKAARIVRGDLVVPKLDDALARYSENIRIARSLEEAEEFCNILDSLPASSVISFDLETTGLDPWHVDAKIITIQFGYRREDGQIEALVIPFAHRNNTWFDYREIWPSIKKLLEKETLKKVGHNIKFDVLYTFSVTGTRVMGIVFDTMLVLHNINSGLNRNYGLKRAVWDWLPETGLGGYEDKLPPLTKLKKLNEEDGEDDNNETEDDS